MQNCSGRQKSECLWRLPCCIIQKPIKIAITTKLRPQSSGSKVIFSLNMGRQLFITRLQISKHEDGTPNLPRLICTPIFVLFQKQTKGMGQKNKTKPTSTPSIENAYLSIHQPVYISISKFKLMYAILPLKRSVTFFYFDDKITMNSLKIPLI